MVLVDMGTVVVVDMLAHIETVAMEFDAEMVVEYDYYIADIVAAGLLAAVDMKAFGFEDTNMDTFTRALVNHYT